MTEAIRARVGETIASVLGRLPSRPLRRVAKRRAELADWRRRRSSEGELLGYHYERFFTDWFGLSGHDYTGKRVLDIGCGPRGTLEWAAAAAERVGLDPLADDYRKLGAVTHAMTYVKGAAESIPFPAAHFDIVASFNSLDHTDDLGQAIAEITRITRPGGLFLLLTEVGHAPTFTEPQSFGWDVLDRFGDRWIVVSAKRITNNGAGMMQSLDAGIELPDNDTGPGYLSALLRRG